MADESIPTPIEEVVEFELNDKIIPITKYNTIVMGKIAYLIILNIFLFNRFINFMF